MLDFLDLALVDSKFATLFLKLLKPASVLGPGGWLRRFTEVWAGFLGTCLRSGKLGGWLRRWYIVF